MEYPDIRTHKHRFNQNNPNNNAYKTNLDNHANQCNPNNNKYAGMTAKINKLR